MFFIVFIRNTIIANEIFRACNVFMVTTSYMDRFFTNCTYMFSIYRDHHHHRCQLHLLHLPGSSSKPKNTSASAVLMVRPAHGKYHQVLQVSQQILFSLAESLSSSSSKITLLHFGQSKTSMFPNRLAT